MWTILLVEDEESVREVTRYVLESAGYLVLEASSPEEAMATFHGFEGTVSLLLTDMVMPTMNGGELAARLRELRPNLHVIFMSGYASATRLHSGFELPGWYLQKPFTTGVLLSRVAEALSLPDTSKACAPGSWLPI